jgi:hypothetical protein
MRARGRWVFVGLSAFGLFACSELVGIGDVRPFDDAAPPLERSDAGGSVPTLADAMVNEPARPDACSSAPLTGDPANCGACGHACLGGGCDAGICQPVLISAGEPHAGTLAVDGEPDGFVYWAETISGGGTVSRIRKDGRAETRQLIYTAEGDEELFANLALRGSRVYWPQLGYSAGAVHGANVDGTAHTKLILTYGTGAVVTDSDLLFAVNRFESGVIVRSTWDFATYSTLYSEDVRTGDSFTLAVDRAPGNGVYWIGGGLHRVDKDGRNYAKLWPKGDLGITVDDTSIYFDAGYGANTTILKMGKDGTCPPSAHECPEVMARGQDNPVCLTTDATWLYWATTEGGTVMRVRKDGTDLSTLASGLDTPSCVAVDDLAVYWVEQGPSGRIQKLAK